ncbi:hypothetical protein [Mycoplasmopsis columbina]|uniref:hypothetical protein n=1 Tax=Mycoplasmopsis columbina TaxID=114881 RepID=UPI0004A75783|nr:hypothetical protein [Mycoplasmopsis columbina]VEU76896.1 Uncharacterised protein [Mycoplasmopsis columbina]
MKKTGKALAIGAAALLIPAVGLSTIAILLLKNSRKDNQQIEKITPFKQLDEETKKAIDYLNKSSLDKKDKDELLTEIQFASQLLTNKNSSTKDMLIQRNALREKVIKSLIRQSLKQNLNQEENEKIFSQLASLIKSPDLKSDYEIVFKEYKESKNLDKFFEQTSSLIEQQNEISIELEVKLYKLLHEYRTKELKITLDEYNSLSQLLKETEELLNSPEYTRDNVQVLSYLFDKVLNEILESSLNLSKEQNQNYIALINKIYEAKAILNETQLEQTTKNLLFRQLDDLRSQVDKNFNVLTLNNNEGLNNANELISFILTNSASYFASEEEIKNDINSLVLNIKEQLTNNEISDIFTQKYQDLLNSVTNKLENSKLTSAQLIDLKINFFNNAFYLKTANLSHSNLINKLNKGQTNNILSKNDLDSFVTQINEKMLKTEKISDLIETIANLENSYAKLIYANQALKDQFVILEKQLETSLDDYSKLIDPINPENVNDKWTTQIKNLQEKVKNVLEKSDSVDNLGNLFENYSNLERLINKHELNLWISKTDEIAAHIKADKELLVKLVELNKSSAPLALTNSTATRAELQQKIAQYTELREKILLSQNLNQIEELKDVIREKIDQKFNPTDPAHQELVNRLNQLQSEAIALSLDSSLPLNEKLARMAEIQEQMNDIESKLDSTKNLEDTFKEAVAEMDKIDDDTDLKNQLAVELKQIKKLMNDARNVFAAPDQEDPLNVNEQLRNALDDYYRKKSQYDSDSAYRQALKAINNTFAPAKTGIQDTPLQAKLKEQLNNLKEKVLDLSLPKEDREAAKQLMIDMANNVQKAYDYEVNKNKLAEIIKKTKELPNNNNFPNDDLNNAQNLLNQANNFFNEINDQNPKNADSYQDYQNLADNLRAQEENLLYQIAATKLKNAVDELKLNKHDLTIEPFSQVNNSIQALLDKKDQLLNQDPKATPEELDLLTAEIERQMKLAQKLKEALDTYAEIDTENQPESAQILKDIILNSTLNSDDNNAQINNKINNLDAELAKIRARQDLKDEIVKLKAVYTAAEKNKTIFSAEAEALDAKITEYERILNSKDSSLNALRSKTEEAQITLSAAQNEKTRIENSYNALVQKIKDKKASLDAAMRNEGLTEAPLLQALYDDFLAKENADSTSFDDLNEIYAKLQLEFNKDVVNKKIADLEAKVATFDTTNAKADFPQAQQAKSKMEETIAALKEQVSNATSPSDLTNINNLKETVQKLQDLAQEQKETIEYLNTTTNQNDLTPLKEKLISTLPTDSSTPNEIQNKTVDLKASLDEYRELDEVKTAEKAKIQEKRDELNNLLTPANASNPEDPANSYDPALKEALNSILDGFVNNVDSAADKPSVADVHNDLLKLESNKTSLLELAQKTKQTQDIIDRLAVKPEEEKDPFETEIQQKLSDALTKARDSFRNPDAATLKDANNDLAQLLDSANALNDFLNEYKEAKAKLALINYPQGNIDLTPQQAKEKFEAYIEKQKNEITSSENVDSILIKSNTVLLRRASSLLDLEKKYIDGNVENNITTIGQKEIVADNSYPNYGFEWDAKNIADSILLSVPDLNNDLKSLENAQNRLIREYDAKINVYKTRKTLIEYINKETEVLGVKVSQLQDLGNEVKYNELKTALTDFYNNKNTTITTVDNFLTLIDIDEEVRRVVNAYSTYKQLAESIDAARIAINSLDSEVDDIKNNQNLVSAKNDLNTAIADGVTKYVQNIDITEINKQKALIDRLKARLTFMLEYAKATNNLVVNFQTDANTIDNLTNNEKASIQKILDLMLVELRENSSLENEENYQKLLNTYVSGRGKYSYLTAIDTAKNLHNAIIEAKSWTVESVENESVEMQTLYTKLNEIISNAENKNVVLAQNKNNILIVEAEKYEAYDKIKNELTGIIAQLKNQKNKEILEQLQIAKNIKDFYQIYPAIDSGQFTPIMSDFEENAIRNLENYRVSNSGDISSANEKIATSKVKSNEQVNRLVTWEKNRLKSIKELIEKYVNFFKDNSDDKTYAKIIAGITDELLNNTSETIQRATNALSSNDSIDVSNYQEKLNGSYGIISQDLENYFTQLIGVARNTSSSTRTELRAFYNELETTENNNSNETNINDLIKALFKTQFDENISSYRTKFEELRNYATNNQEQLNAALNPSLGSIDYNMDLSEEIKAQRETNYRNFVEYINNHIKNAYVTLNNLIYGSENTSGLKQTNTTYITKRTNFANMLNLIAKNEAPFNNLTNSQFFEDIINFYSVQSTIARNIDQAAGNVLIPLQSSLRNQLLSLKNTLKISNNLRLWLLNESNKRLFFNYLTQTTNGTRNSKLINAKDEYLSEVFVNKVNELATNKTTFTAGANTYDALEISSSSPLLEYFNAFPLVKGQNPYNENVKVYLFKEQTDESFTQTFLQTDTSIKKVKVNLRFVYQPPIDNTNIFNDVTSFQHLERDVLITFKTLDLIHFDKSLIETKENMNTAPLFHINDAGWNAYATLPNLIASFNEYGTLNLIKNNLSYFTENVNVNLNDTDQRGSTSTPNLRFKIKFKDDATFNLRYPTYGSTEVTKYIPVRDSNGDTFIYWKPLSADFSYDRNTRKYTHSLGISVFIPLIAQNPDAITATQGKISALNIYFAFRNANGGGISVAETGNQAFVLGSTPDGSTARDKNETVFITPHADSINQFITDANNDLNIASRNFSKFLAAQVVNKIDQWPRYNTDPKYVVFRDNGNYFDNMNLGRENLFNLLDKFDFQMKLHVDRTNETNNTQGGN